SEFWNKYHDGDACTSQPCLNKGVCKDGIGRYTCFCPELFQGYNCEIAIPQLCEVNNGGCEHYCKVDQKKGTTVCSCAKGYNLAEDRKSCYSDQPFKCGHVFPKTTRSILSFDPIENVTNTANDTSLTSVNKGNLMTFTENKTVTKSTQDQGESHSFFGLIDIAPTVKVEPELPKGDGEKRIVNGEDCPPGECPWQALLINEDNMGFCGGTILNEYFILSAAHCMKLSRSIKVILGETYTMSWEGREAIHEVEQVLVHTNYQPDTYHNDIALIKLVKPINFTKYIIPACLPERDFAERVLMQQDEGLVSGFGRLQEGGMQATTLQRLTVPYVDRSICRESTKFNISPRMFCAGYSRETKDACQGDSGGPHVTRYKNTWFVTGVVSWGEGCARKDKYGIYTQVSKYLKWIDSVMEQVTAESATSRKKRWAPGHVPVIREEFWTKYYDGDQCKPNPCQHGSICKDKIGGYICKCTKTYTGENCEKDISECPSGGSQVCEHYCRPLPESYRCICARGYNLHTDGRSCIPQAQDPCGYLRVISEDVNQRNMYQNDAICPQGKCPWQVTFVDVGGDVICQGVILGKRSILTTAACMKTGKDFSLVIGEHQPSLCHSDKTVNASQLSKKTLHSKYLTGRPDDDLAFLELKEPITLGLGAIQLCLPEKDFSENILMKSGKEGVVVGGANKPSYLPLWASVIPNST
ncbi:hypothetical protein QTP86_024457, partial [Hemibagrus guttatus]